MFSIVKRLQNSTTRLRAAVGTCQVRSARIESGSNRNRSRGVGFVRSKKEEKSEWWIMDGEIHEIGDHVPPRERFVIPRDNIPNRRRKQLREQFMRRTRLVLKESEHEPWCKRYMELYQELRENWERLYWDEGYSKRVAREHANYDSAEDDNRDFNPYRSRRNEPRKDQSFGRNGQPDTWDKVSQIRDKFEYDREMNMRRKAFAPMNGNNSMDSANSNSRNQPFDAKRYFPEERD